ncbi:hypothetical protein [Vibrio sp. ER1A]|uniref:hypothetical protein n=1 Tax=Vibrio sp. ER1A TaxID=1517681 RepID=UPI0004DD095D|nr:hypothetical protein [Vibrio sp. ER1A]KFA98847.1 hypothetical protein HW45_07455 [Vibrio sp. ER1A]
MSVDSYRHQVVEFQSGLLVFSRDYLVEHVEKLNGLSPEQVLCESSEGIFRDYGNGVYAYLPKKEFGGVLSLRCLIEGVPLQVQCNLLSEPHIVVPEQFQLMRPENSPIGYSILSDGTIAISRDALVHLVNEKLGQTEGGSPRNAIEVRTVSTDTVNYQCKLTKEFCFVSSPHPHSINSAQPLSCVLIVEAFNLSNEQRFELVLTLDFTLLKNLIVKTENTMHSRNALEQIDLVGSPSQFASPIVYADSVYSFSNESYLRRLPDGSFSQPKSEPKGYIYLLSDAVEYIATGIFITHMQAVPMQTSLKASNKWCDIEVNKRDLISTSVSNQCAKSLHQLVFEHSDLVQVKSESEGDLTLSSVNRSKGLGKLSLSGEDGDSSDGYLTFDLIFMPNLIFDNCIQTKTGNYWEVSTREIKALLSRRVHKRIAHIDVNCSDGLVTANNMHTFTLWAVNRKAQTQLNLTLSFDDGTLGFSSITI